MKAVEVLNTLTGETRTFDTAAVFAAIGIQPQTELVKDLLTLDEYGFVITNENMMTNIDGVYAVGDMRRTPLRQIVTAVADGAVAATHAALNT